MDDSDPPPPWWPQLVETTLECDGIVAVSASLTADESFDEVESLNLESGGRRVGYCISKCRINPKAPHCK
jgi:hypothetical protein